MMTKKRSKKYISADDEEELCVFGYEVKWFPNDSTIVHEEPPMIRLPYAEEIEVDRYDCRLFLDSTSQIGEALDKENSVPDFVEDYLCEEERYLDLKELEKEENPFASKKTSATVPWKYEATPTSPPPEEPFEPPKDQFYPSGMPSTKKQALLIEKTAKFVIEKGAEYESIITDKASSNKQLIFLKLDDPLNEYYNFILSLMKDGIYVTIPTEDPNALYFGPSLKRKLSPEITEASQPKKLALKSGLDIKEKENQLDPKLYFEWYQRFYNEPSPYYPNMIPLVIKPSTALAITITNQADLVAQNGCEQEKLLAVADPSNVNHMNFANPYYMFYQNHLFKRCMELEKAQMVAAAIKEGVPIDDVFESPATEEMGEEELKQQLERRQKAHYYLKTIFAQRMKEKEASATAALVNINKE